MEKEKVAAPRLITGTPEGARRPLQIKKPATFLGPGF